jgi:hypothetical protein
LFPLSLGYKGYTHTAPLVITATHIGLTGMHIAQVSTTVGGLHNDVFWYCIWYCELLKPTRKIRPTVYSRVGPRFYPTIKSLVP